MIKSNSLTIKKFFLVSFVFIILNNNFFNYDESILYGQTDGITYFKIAEAAPNISIEKLPYHKAQRFLLPYITGVISKYLIVDIYTLFRIFSFCLVGLILLIFKKIFNKLNVEINFQIFLFSLIIFNPYIMRYYLATPLMINDLLFLLSGTLLILSFISSNKWLLSLSIFLATVSRPESIFFILALIISKVIYKKKYIFSLNSIIINLIIFSLIFLLNNHHASIIGADNIGAFALEERFGLFIFNYSLKEFLIFIILPLFNFFPILLIFLFCNHKLSGHRHDGLLIFSIIIVFLTMITPFISGPIATGKNIIRLINLSYPFMIYIFYKILIIKNNLSLYKKILFLFIIILWSLHPTYSNVNIFLPLSKIFSY
jgi:hypothetical protein